jgi:hypothetical protein
VFDDDRYFDVFVEFAKSSPEDILIQITVWNHGPEAASLHVLPHLFFRNIWSWHWAAPRPVLRRFNSGPDHTAIAAEHPYLGERFLLCEGAPDLLFTENETNRERLFHKPNASPYVKDAFHNYLIHGRSHAVNLACTGTKFAADYLLDAPSQDQQVVRLRLLDPASNSSQPFGNAFEDTFGLRRKEADEFFVTLVPPTANEDERRVMRQALAGMLWSKQYYCFDLDLWLREHGWNPGQRSQPGYAGRRLLSICSETKLRRILTRMLDEDRFPSKYGIRALSRASRSSLRVQKCTARISLCNTSPLNRRRACFGGNSNWRGPIWVPVNTLIIRALLIYYGYFGDSFKIECPTGSGIMMTLFEVATELSRRLSSTFLRDAAGKRPVFGQSKKFQLDPHWRITSCFTSIFTETMARALAPATRPAEPGSPRVSSRPATWTQREPWSPASV